MKILIIVIWVIFFISAFILKDVQFEIFAGVALLSGMLEELGEK